MASCLYCSYSKEFKSFLKFFEDLPSDISACKPSVSAILGDFNARSTSRWANDTDSAEGFSLSTTSGFQQITSKAYTYSMKQLFLHWFNFY